MKAEAAAIYLTRNLNRSIVLWDELPTQSSSVYDDSIKISHFQYSKINNTIDMYEYNENKKVWNKTKSFSLKDFAYTYKNREFDKRYYCK